MHYNLLICPQGEGLRHSRPSTYPSLPCKPRPTLSTTLPKRRSITPRARRPGPLKAVAIRTMSRYQVVFAFQNLSSSVIASPVTPRKPPATRKILSQQSLAFLSISLSKMLSRLAISPLRVRICAAARRRRRRPRLHQHHSAPFPFAISPAGVRLAGALRQDEHCVGAWRVHRRVCPENPSYHFSDAAPSDTSLCPHRTSQTLKERVMQLVPEKQKELKEISTKYGATSLGPVTVAQASFRFTFWPCTPALCLEVPPCAGHRRCPRRQVHALGDVAPRFSGGAGGV